VHGEGHLIKFLRGLGRATLGLGLFMLGLAGLVWWYIGQGPIPLDVLTPRLQAAISRAVPGLDVRFGTLSASHDALRQSVLIRAKNVTLRHALLAQPATVSEMTLLVPRAALIGDDPTPREITLTGVRGAMIWTPEQVRKWLTGNGDDLPPRLKWLRGLDQVKIRDVRIDLAQISVNRSGRSASDTLAIDELDAERGLLLNRDKIQLKLKASLAEVGGKARISVKADGQAIPGGQWEATVKNEVLHPQRYIRDFVSDAYVPRLLPRFSVTTKLTATNMIRGNTVLRAAPGKFLWSPEYPQPLNLQEAEVRLQWNDSSSEFNLRKFDLLAEGVRLTLAGTVNGRVPARSRLTGKFKTLSISQLVTLWPKSAAVGGREWIAENISSGTIRNGMLRISPANPGATDPQVALRFEFKDLVAHYRRPMPPLLNANGIGTLDNRALVLNVALGTINGVSVPKASVTVGLFSEVVQYATVDLDLAGDLPKLLAVLDSEPLGFISRYGLKPETVSGVASGNVKLKIPLLKSVTLDDITLSATAKTRMARVPDIYAGKPLEKADLDFVVLRDGLVAKGSAFLNGNPLQIKWEEGFSGTVENPTRYDVSTRTSVSALAELGIDMQAIAIGDFPVTLALAGKGAVVASGNFTADIGNVQFTIPPFGIVKAAGVPGRAFGHFSQLGRTVVFDQLQVASEPVSAQLSARIPVDEGLSEFDVASFIYGANKLKGTLAFGNTGPIIVRVNGGELDLRPELIAWRKAQLLKPARVPPRALVASSLSLPGALEQTTQVSGKIDRIKLLNDIDISSVQFETRLTGELMQTGVFKGLLGEKANSQIVVLTESGVRKLKMSSENAGLLATALDLYKNGSGGKILVDADFAGRDKALTITGRATIKDFRILNAPGLAKTLTIASLTGLTDTLRGRGIEFKSVDAPFTLKRGVVDIRKASAVGPGLGITMEGQISRATGQTNLRGTIIPSYGLNAAVGKIPLLGKVIVGGKNQGLIGFQYRIKGTMIDPKIDVTKSSGLAPGFLRQLFKGKAAVIDPAYEEIDAAGSAQ
jgi:hypothetical protein